MKLTYFGLYPRTKLDSEKSFVCPKEGSPPTEDSGWNYLQPLANLTIPEKVKFIWKVKKWRVNATINANVDWIDNSVDPPETGTLSVTRTVDQVLILKNDFTLETPDVEFPAEIGCNITFWEYAGPITTSSIVVFVYDEGLSLNLAVRSYDGFVGADILNSDVGLIGFFGEVPVTFDFFETQVNSTLYAYVGNNDANFPELSPTQTLENVTITGGNIDITVEEPWDYTT